MGGKKKKKRSICVFVWRCADEDKRRRTNHAWTGRAGRSSRRKRGERNGRWGEDFIVGDFLFFLSVRARIDDVGISLRMMMMMMINDEANDIQKGRRSFDTLGIINYIENSYGCKAKVSKNTYVQSSTVDDPPGLSKSSVSHFLLALTISVR